MTAALSQIFQLVVFNPPKPGNNTEKIVANEQVVYYTIIIVVTGADIGRVPFPQQSSAKGDLTAYLLP